MDTRMALEIKLIDDQLAEDANLTQQWVPATSRRTTCNNGQYCSSEIPILAPELHGDFGLENIECSQPHPPTGRPSAIRKELSRPDQTSLDRSLIRQKEQNAFCFIYSFAVIRTGIAGHLGGSLRSSWHRGIDQDRPARTSRLRAAHLPRGRSYLDTRLLGLR